MAVTLKYKLHQVFKFSAHETLTIKTGVLGSGHSKMAALGRQTLAFARIRTLLFTNHTVSAIRSLSAIQEASNTRRRKKESAAEKAENVQIQKNYLQSVKSVVARFRAERLAEEERKAAAESEQQRLLQQERQLDQRIVEDLKLENELLAKRRYLPVEI